MKRSCTHSLWLLLLLLQPVQSLDPPKVVIDPTAEKKLIDGKILTEMVRVPDSKTRRCRAFAVVEAPPHVVWEVISEYNRFHEFMPRTPVSFLVDSDYVAAIAGNEVRSWKKFEEDLADHRATYDAPGDLAHFYSRFDMPWPMKDRYTLTEMVRDESRFYYHWRQISGNMKENRGSWLLKPFPGRPGKTLAVYTLYANPGLFVPSVFVKMAVKGSLPGVVAAVRLRVKERFSPQSHHR